MHFHLVLLKKQRITWFFSKMLQCSFATEPTITYKQNSSYSAAQNSILGRGQRQDGASQCRAGRAVTGTSTTPDYVTRGVLGLYKQPPCALLWDSHTTGTLNVSTKDLISLIKQFIAHNMEIALGLCFHYLPLSLNPTSNSAQIKVGVF